MGEQKERKWVHPKGGKLRELSRIRGEGVRPCRCFDKINASEKHKIGASPTHWPEWKEGKAKKRRKTKQREEKREREEKVSHLTEMGV